MLKLLLVLVGACLVTGDDQGALEALSDNVRSNQYLFVSLICPAHAQYSPRI